MTATHKLFVPAFGITTLLTCIAIYRLLAGGSSAPHVILWAAVIICLWSLYFLVQRKMR